jgi:hypothetical protein
MDRLWKGYMSCLLQPRGFEAFIELFVTGEIFESYTSLPDPMEQGLVTNRDKASGTTGGKSSS